MHLSLKASLGRPFIDSAPSGILNAYPGAAGAYSLRALSSAWARKPVVRVRRASDNSEDDFNASKVASGAMTDWVNAQIVPPLDVRELVDGERTGALIPAAAAYSLRNLSASYTGNVVDVRRSTGGTDSFTASEVADGTLATWVGAGNDGFVTQWYDQSGNDDHATQTTPSSQPKIVDAGVLETKGIKFEGAQGLLTGSPIISDIKNAASFAVFSVPDNQDPVDGFVAFVSHISRWYIKARRSYVGLNNVSAASVPVNNADTLRTITTSDSACSFFNNGTQYGSTEDITEGDYTLGTGIGSNHNATGGFITGNIEEIILYNSDQSANRTAFEANIGETYGIALPSGVDTGYDNVNGFVETWYDQSGEGNDATQTVAASQPKIVDAGVLVDGGIDFDGSGDFLETDLVPPNTATMIGVANWDRTNALRMVLGARDSLSQRSYLAQLDTGLMTIGVANSQLSTAAVVAGDDYLMFGIHDSPLRLLSTNGTVASDLLGSDPNNTVQGYSIGALNSGGANGSFMEGKISEVIIYPSNQSANQDGIETNINDYYNIYEPTTTWDDNQLWNDSNNWED